MKLNQLLVTLASIAGAASLNLKVSNTGGNNTSPLLYGLLYEDVYHSGDGGIYGEMIQNRGMTGIDLINGEVNRNLVKWHNLAGCDLELDNSPPQLSSALPFQMSAAVPTGATGTTGMWNEGFSGFNVTTATRYAASFWLRGDYVGDMTGSFMSNTSHAVLGSTTFSISQSNSQGWVHYENTFRVPESAPDHANTFHLTFDAGSTAGRTIYFHVITVFQQTFQDSKMRMDLGNALNDVGGKFLRFPGGNNMEGGNGHRWTWSNTIGVLEDRPGRPGTWGWYNTDGFGLLEMFEMCQLMKLEPVLALWGGFYLGGPAISEADLPPYIEDAMNELEFLMGSTSTKYGALRASLGPFEPFKIKYIEIGNEDEFDGSGSYQKYRFNMFYDAIHAVYPDITIISSLCINDDLPMGNCGPGSSLSNPPVGVATDLHLYQSADATVAFFNAFDNMDRTYPILIGEYAAIYNDGTTGPELEHPTLQSAASEAVMFLGLERNSDVVFGSCHGALLKSINDEPNHVAILKYNADTIVPSYSYEVVKMFAQNYGSQTAPTTSDSGYGPLYWSSTVGPGGTYVKIVNYNGAASTPVTVEVSGSTATTAKLTTLTGPDTYSTNLLGAITSSVTETTVQGSSGTFSFTLNGSYTVAVLVI